ncbi:MAG TPA: HlyD family efflux transporter periplasmic adaptor subunit [Bryobacteraceae bacterium]|nr:HlyD family efflux transporter periplasmic adaptor subunit [Bryobacteraceae bacterium]
MKKLIIRILILVVVLGAGWWGYSYVRQMPERRQDVPLAKVRQGEVVISAFARGELRALRSESLVAPNLMGTVQVTQLAPIGALAREKDLIVEFDDSEVLSRIEENQLNMQSADENIKRQEAELAIRNNQDQVELLGARYAVRRAELQVKRNDLLSAIDARKNVLALDQAKRSLAQMEADTKARQEQAQAQLALLRQQRSRVMLELTREQRRLQQTRLLATMSGLVAVRQNSFGGARMFGAQVPDIREGDQVQPGMPVADILDLSELEVVAKIGELDRANLVEGQDTLVTLDALAGKRIHGKIKSMSGTATANVMAGDPSKKFEVLFSVDMKELLTTVGATPEQIREVMATAEKNRSRPISRTSLSSLPAMNGGAPQGAGLRSGANGQGGFPDAAMAQAFAAGGGMRARSGEEQGGASGGGQRPSGAARGGDQSAAASGGAGRGRGEGGGMSGPPGMGFFGRGGGSQFSVKEVEAAKLPPPPQEDGGLQVLLRPGLLADIEVIIEKIPNAIYIPAQAVFEREGRPVVYVKTGDRFEERAVRLAKRSESTMVISEGLKAGEEIALTNPSRQASQKKEAGKSPGGSNPMGAAPTKS